MSNAEFKVGAIVKHAAAEAPKFTIGETIRVTSRVPPVIGQRLYRINAVCYDAERDTFEYDVTKL